ncbi:MAG: prohibitin family protein [Limnoraphis robusta]|jgi:regulator of protease activity HflC (stomatin/prohibitin superfamily)
MKIPKILKLSNLVFLFFLILVLLNPFAIVNAGERGVVLRFGEVQNKILGEGLHLIIPVVDTVVKLNVRIQKQDIPTEASSKDLQEVFTDVALNWHILPKKANFVFQTIGDESKIINGIITPSIEEIFKAVIAQYTAEEMITKRNNVKAEIDSLLIQRLKQYNIEVDDIALITVHFSQRFTEAVEAKQIAEQEAKKAGFMALKALKEAERTINLARGEAVAHQIIQQTLTPEILQKQAIEKWNGSLPLVIDSQSLKLLDFNSLTKNLPIDISETLKH